MNKNNSDNFDSKAEIQRIKDDFGSILNQPDKFAEVFCKAAQSQKNIDNALQVIIKDLIQKDQITRDSLKDLIKEYEKQEWSNIIRKWFSIVGAIILITVSAIIGRLLK